MKEELRDKLVRSFPDLFKSTRIKDISGGFNPMIPRDNTTPFWVDTDDGWYDLLYELCTRIQEVIDTEEYEELRDRFRVLQVKEKYGGLRFYIGGAPPSIHDLIDEAEKKSYVTCEICGDLGELMTNSKGRGGWYKTLCSKCGDEKEYGPPIRGDRNE